MNMLAKHFADQVAQKIKKDDLQQGKVYFGKELDYGEYVTVEEYIEGNFVKYNTQIQPSLQAEAPPFVLFVFCFFFLLAVINL